MGKFNINVNTNVDKSYLDPVEELEAGLDDSVATFQTQQDIAAIGQDPDEARQMIEDQEALNLLLQDQNLPGVKQQIAEGIPGATPSSIQQDPSQYNQLGQQLGQVTGEGGINRAGEQVAWKSPDIVQTPATPGQGVLAPTRVDSIQNQKGRTAFGELSQDSTEGWVDKWQANDFTEPSDITNFTDQVDTFKSMSGKMHNTIKNGLEYRLRGADAESFINGIAKGKGFKPASVAQYMNYFVNSYAQLEEHGVGEAFGDALMAARLQDMKNQEWESVKRDQDADKDRREAGYGKADIGVLTPVKESTQKLKETESDQRVGRMVNKLLGVKSNEEADAIAGALARRFTNEAFGADGMFERRQARTGSPKAGTEYRYETEGLTKQGLDMVNGLQSMFGIIMPEAAKVPRNYPTPGEPNTQHPRGKFDRNKHYGDYAFVNKTNHTLNNTPMKLGVGLTHSVFTELQSHPGMDKIKKIKLDEFSSERKELVYETDAKGKKIMTNGSPTIAVDRNGEPKQYAGNNTKDKMFEAELEFAASQNGGVLYWDHFLGSNNRFYVDAAIGNYQSSKLARALLRSAAKVVYNIKPKSSDLAQMKAGIMKKFGYDKHNVQGAVEAFDFNNNTAHSVRTWQKWLATPESRQANADKILEVAAKEEGAMSLDAMVEAVQLQNAIDAGDTQYTSDFITEVDGVANGVAHNILQAGGNERIQNATNLFSPEMIREMSKGVWKKGDDVYKMTAGKMIEMLKGSNGKPETTEIDNWILMNFKDDTNQNLIDRGMGKKPMMIFGYGAGDATIKRTVGIYVDELMSNPNNRVVHDKLIGEDSDVTVQQVRDRLGDIAVEAVGTEFTAVKKLNEVMASMAKIAANAGINPIITTAEGHRINLGLFESKQDLEFGTAGYVDVGGGVQTAIKRGQINPQAGNKAATQAGVLGTHANDGINIGMTMNHFADTQRGNVAAQVFDGVMMPPKYAAEYSDQLNRDFYVLNKQFTAVTSLANNLKARGLRLPRDLLNKIRIIEKTKDRLFDRLKQEHVKQFFWN